jgi:hypothetical protein
MKGQRDLDLLAELTSERAQLSGHYQELASLIWPDHAVFYRQAATGMQEGQKRALELVDPTAAIAADRCASALMSMTAPTHKRYQAMAIDDEELAENPRIKQYLEELTKCVFRYRYAPRSGFAAQYHEGCKSSVVFGPMATFVESGTDGPVYHALSMSNTYFLTDEAGRVNGCVRVLEFTAQQLAEKFGEDALPAKIRQKLTSTSQGERLQKWKVLHVIEQLPQEKPITGWRYSGRYVAEEGKTVLEERGYRSLPIAASRFSTMPGEKYGRSIAMTVLPAIKGLQRMVADFIKGVHKQVDPPLLAFDDDGVMTAIKAQPGRVTTGGMNADGKPLVAPLSQPGRLDWGQQLIDDQRRQVNDAFLTTLFQILTTEPASRQQTAYEVSVREVEKAALLSPSTDRIQDEYFGTLVPREIAILEEMGVLPPKPEELMGREGEIKIKHTGELARAQAADKLLGIQRTLEVAPMFAQLDPTSIKKIKWADALGEFAEGAGMAVDLLLSKDDLDAAREADEQQAAIAAAAELAPGAGQGAKAFAEAEQIRQGQANLLGGYV